MSPESLPACLRVLRLLRRPRTVVGLAKRTGRCVKSVRRDIARLRRMGFRILADRENDGEAKTYTAVDPVRDFHTIMRGERKKSNGTASRRRAPPAPRPKAQDQSPAPAKTLAERIRDRRAELGLTQAAAADRAGMDRANYARIEAGGRTDLRASTLRQLAAALDMPIGELVG